jgi:uncharacterized cupredoxin-like copper-binding protein
MHLTRLAIVSLVIIVAACSGGGSAVPASPGASGGATRIDIGLTDALRIEPAEMTVAAGVPVTFVVTNRGAIEHEFVIGDDSVQAAHEEEMASGGMGHDEANRITLDAGETKELIYTFDEPGETLAGCHLPGHYGGGMRATITISG